MGVYVFDVFLYNSIKLSSVYCYYSPHIFMLPSVRDSGAWGGGGQLSGAAPAAFCTLLALLVQNAAGLAVPTPVTTPGHPGQHPVQTPGGPEQYPGLTPGPKHEPTPCPSPSPMPSPVPTGCPPKFAIFLKPLSDSSGSDTTKFPPEVAYPRSTIASTSLSASKYSCSNYFFSLQIIEIHVPLLTFSLFFIPLETRITWTDYLTNYNSGPAMCMTHPTQVC